MYTEKNEYGLLIVKKADPSLPSDMLHVQLPAGAPVDGSSRLLKGTGQYFPAEHREALTQVRLSVDYFVSICALLVIVTVRAR
jgi:hypothetical protein